MGIYFISHVGGHKFSANVMIYRKASVVKQSSSANGDGLVQGIQERLDELKVEDEKGNEVVLDANKDGKEGGKGGSEAAQCIWLARIRPEDCENVVRYTVLQGKVVKPGSQLRGGFDRCKQVVSW